MPILVCHRSHCTSLSSPSGKSGSLQVLPGSEQPRLALRGPFCLWGKTGLTSQQTVILGPESLTVLCSTACTAPRPLVCAWDIMG